MTLMSPARIEARATDPAQHPADTDSAIALAAPRQGHLFEASRSPVLAAWGAGVDSTAMLIEMVETQQPVDAVLFADTGSEHPETYLFAVNFMRWLMAREIPCAVVRYQPRDFKNWPPYRTLEENCLTNGTLPSKAFGFGACSMKWKIAPQNRWTQNWEPARRVWAAGGKVVKLIGYDCSPADSRRYAEREGYDDPRYVYRYPLREWGWTRDRCAERIREAGLPVPRKSACFFCPAMKPHELHSMPAALLRRIVLMEARAKPRLRNVDGLWRKPVLGKRGATPRPGSMTEHIGEHALLPVQEIERIAAVAPQSLVRWQQAMGQLAERPDLKEWLRLFDAAAADGMRTSPTPDLYAS